MNDHRTDQAYARKVRFRLFLEHHLQGCLRFRRLKWSGEVGIHNTGVFEAVQHFQLWGFLTFSRLGQTQVNSLDVFIDNIVDEHLAKRNSSGQSNDAAVDPDMVDDLLAFYSEESKKKDESAY
ncbi:hypothetical protein NE237_012928 [Protea cynaroides]|uniref:Uncharacterized protein n=1 Tax=Protea cynaroides TaxID=273540 RepID=A0A9Q0GYZ6_9MAGN|nr:hypothetical protein NE237_012928 [Protea cynaroides]